MCFKKNFTAIVMCMILVIATSVSYAAETANIELKCFGAILENNLNCGIETNSIDCRKFEVDRVKLSKVNLNNKISCISGEIENEKFCVLGKLEFDKVGNLFFSKTEEHNGFTILDATIEKNDKYSLVYFDDKQNNPGFDYVIKLYLQKNNKIYLIESFSNKNLISFEKKSNLKQGKNPMKYWYTKIQKPEVTRGYVKKGHTWDRRYDAKYRHLGLDFEHFMIVSMEVKVKDICRGETGDFDVKLFVDKEGVICEDPKYGDLNDSSFRIEDVKIHCAVDKGDCIHDVRFDASATKLGWVRFDVQCNYNQVKLFDYLGFSANLSYDFDEDYDFDETHRDFQAKKNKCVRSFCSELDDDYVLEDEGDNYSVEVGVENLSYEEEHSNKFNIIFEYKVNKLGYDEDGDNIERESIEKTKHYNIDR